MLFLKKILLITNNALIDGDANGRTLGALLEGYPKDYLMQFCTNGNSVDSKYIVNAYKFSDKDAIRSVFKPICNCKKLAVDKGEIGKVTSEVRVKKTSAVIFAREIIWKTIVPRLDLINIAEEFAPDIILLQLGACAFTAKIAYDLTVKLNAKLIIFTTEDYYFKKWNYIDPGKRNAFFFFISYRYKKMLKKIFRKAECCICNTPFLAKIYEQEFGAKTRVIMNAANKIKSNEDNVIDEYKIVYAGNLGLERYVSLIDIAKEIYKISTKFHLDIYGEFSQEIIARIKNEPNLRLKGFATYQDVLREMASAKLVLHMESLKEFYAKDLRAAFSTKIPDSLACQTPLFLYAPENLAETKYLEENKCAFVCTKHEDLHLIVKQALTNEKMRELILKNAEDVVNRNHTHETIQKNFMGALEI